MKRKIEKKLVLNKETIVDLKNEEMNSAKGGTKFTRIHEECGSILSLCCPTTI